MLQRKPRSYLRMVVTRFAAVLTAIVACVSDSQPAFAQPGSWFNYTNEVGDNDLFNLQNWRWGRDGGMPTGVVAYGHPADLTQLQNTTKFLSAAGSGFSAAKGNVYTSATIGNGQTFNLNGQLDGGFTLTVTGTGVLTSSGFTANGLGLNVVRDMPTSLGGDNWGNTARYYRPNGALTTNPSNNKNWFGNSLETTLHIHSGGTLNNTGGTDTGINSNIGPIGQMGYDLDSRTGPITANVTGRYRMGAQTGNGTGGGWLQLRGYNASTSITMGELNIVPGRNANDVSQYSDTSTGMTGSYGIYGISTGDSTGPPNVAAGAYPGTPLAPDPNFYASGSSYDGNKYLISVFNGDPSAYLLYDSKAAQLRVQLTSQNNGGLFNPVAVTTLSMPNISTVANTTDLPEFVLSLSGYTPVVGDLFPIVTAVNAISGTGEFNVGWDTDFIVGTTQFKLLPSYTDPDTSVTSNGVFLEVTAVGVPEPGTVGLLAAAGGLAGCFWYRRRR